MPGTTSDKETYPDYSNIGIKPNSFRRTHTRWNSNDNSNETQQPQLHIKKDEQPDTSPTINYPKKRLSVSTSFQYPIDHQKQSYTPPLGTGNLFYFLFIFIFTFFPFPPPPPFFLCCCIILRHSCHFFWPIC